MCIVYTIPKYKKTSVINSNPYDSALFRFKKGKKKKKKKKKKEEKKKKPNGCGSIMVMTDVGLHQSSLR